MAAMRTTISLDDDLLRLVKERAHDESQTLSEVVTLAVQRYLTAEPRRQLGAPLM